MDADVVWENARRFIEDNWQDPPDLWKRIERFTKEKWQSKWNVYKLHRFPKAHERVWRIGSEVQNRYSGDARIIWKDKTPDEVYERLQEMRVGPQISRMVVGALLDTKQIEGSFDVKADLNVRRVLGRVIKNKILTAEEAIKITRKMHEENPWILDRPLYYVGKSYCFASDPYCAKCYLQKECKFSQSS